MNPPIEFEAKTDRELLIQVVVTTNNISEKLVKIVDCIDNHERRMDILEKQEPPIVVKSSSLTERSITAGIALGVSGFMAWLFNKLGIG